MACSTLSVLVGLGLIIIVASEAEANGHRQKFGESCSRYKKCDFTKFFRCLDGKCVCYQGNEDGKIELYYDEVAERCVGRSGTNCSQKFYPFDDEDNTHFHMRGTTTNHWRYGNGSLRCGANAFCDYDGQNHFCNCRKNYYETDDGKCLKLKSHSDACTSDRECDPDAFLHCNSGHCTCTRGNSHVYDATLNKCVVRAGLPCEIRRNRLDKRVLDDCMVDSFCEASLDLPVCRCKRGTQIHSDRTCQTGFGGSCGPDHPCGDSKLTCRSKVCQCMYPLHMKYDEGTGQCLSLAAGPCHYNDTSETGIHCVQNAECVKRGLFSECHCKQGFFQTKDGDCVKVYGSECEFDSDCDRVGPLACINSRCECPDLLLKHDPKTRKCKGLVGSRCSINDDNCVDNAKCNRFTDIEKSGVGSCLCLSGYRESLNRTCVSNY